MNTNSYESPFCTRYASREMQYLFSADKKFTTWRRLWVALRRPPRRPSWTPLDHLLTSAPRPAQQIC